MGAPVGNKNAANAKLWKAAIERALDKRGAGDRMAALDSLAEKLLSLCDQADLQALKEFGDRIDGKAVASTEISGPDGVALPVSLNVRFPGA